MHVDEVHAEAGGDRPRDAADVLLALLEDDVVKLLCQLPALREAERSERVSERRLKRGAAIARGGENCAAAGGGLERRQRRRGRSSGGSRGGELRSDAWRARVRKPRSPPLGAERHAFVAGARGEFLLVVANLRLPLREEDARSSPARSWMRACARDALVGVLQRDVLACDAPRRSPGEPRTRAARARSGRRQVPALEAGCAGSNLAAPRRDRPAATRGAEELFTLASILLASAPPLDRGAPDASRRRRQPSRRRPRARRTVRGMGTASWRVRPRRRSACEAHGARLLLRGGQPPAASAVGRGRLSAATRHATPDATRTTTPVAGRRRALHGAPSATLRLVLDGHPRDSPPSASRARPPSAAATRPAEEAMDAAADGRARPAVRRPDRADRRAVNSSPASRPVCCGRRALARAECLLLKFAGDGRYSETEVVTHELRRGWPRRTARGVDAAAAMDGADVVGIDEGQF